MDVGKGVGVEVDVGIKVGVIVGLPERLGVSVGGGTGVSVGMGDDPGVSVGGGTGVSVGMGDGPGTSVGCGTGVSVGVASVAEEPRNDLTVMGATPNPRLSKSLPSELSVMPNVTTPTTFPSALRIGPPLLPGFTAASVCTTQRSSLSI